jgi:hypothetical protein
MCLREAVEEEHRGACAARSHCDRRRAHIDNFVPKALEHTAKYPPLTPLPAAIMFRFGSLLGARPGVGPLHQHQPLGRQRPIRQRRRVLSHDGGAATGSSTARTRVAAPMTTSRT